MNQGPFQALKTYILSKVVTVFNSDSSALNKWLRNRLGEGNVIHGFRHSMRDRLRAVECPSDLIDQIGGWTRGSVGEGYGKGYELNIKFDWIKKLKC